MQFFTKQPHIDRMFNGNNKSNIVPTPDVKQFNYTESNY